MKISPSCEISHGQRWKPPPERPRRGPLSPSCLRVWTPRWTWAAPTSPAARRQRLLIARALADRPEILILDNADSALDYSTAAALRQALRRDFPGTTLVIISERVSAVREADCILVLENGRIDAQGLPRRADGLLPALSAHGQAPDGR